MAVPANLPALVAGAIDRAMEQIDRVLRHAVATGADARGVAGRIARYLSPHFAPRRNAAGERARADRPGSAGGWPAAPGMASQGVRVIAEHEIGKAHGARAVVLAQRTPGYGIRWLLSPAHGKRDECDAKASGSSAGLPRGLYLPSEVPVHPSHPRCACALIAEPLP